MRKKFRRTNKMLKDLRGMKFLYREKSVEGFKTIRDYFRHDKAQITLVRVQTVVSSQWVHWECVELGGGNAGIGYWLKLSAKRLRPEK